MRYVTTVDIELFDFHGSPVRAVAIDGDSIRLSLDSARLLKGHPVNPEVTAQSIQPCTVLLKGIRRNEPKLWSADTSSYSSHPDPSHPLSGALTGAEAIKTDTGYALKISGFHALGAVVWEVDCVHVEVSWNAFTGSIWVDADSWASFK